jgi:hypothetical protein
MRRRAKVLLGLLLLSCFSITAVAQRCGVERWSVKTGSDADVGNVHLSSPQTATIAQLIALLAPSPIPKNNRVAPTETTVFVVNATLTDYKLESGSSGDSDYHLVLQDGQGNTMIAEIPSPHCVDGSSPFASQIATARAAFDSQFTATSSFQTANIPVQVTGVGMFDFFHNQRGVAPNVIELHPVLNIVFNPSTGDGGGGDFSLSVPFSTIQLAQGGLTSVTVSASSTTGTVPSVTFSATGLPTGVTFTITPVGNGKATVSLQASTAAPTGSFPFTVTGTAGAKVHSQTATLNISATPAPTGQAWEYQVVTATSDQDMVDKANQLGAQDWEMVGIVRQGTNGWKAFFKRAKRDF